LVIGPLPALLLTERAPSVGQDQGAPKKPAGGTNGAAAAAHGDPARLDRIRAAMLPRSTNRSCSYRGGRRHLLALEIFPAEPVELVVEGLACARGIRIS